MRFTTRGGVKEAGTCSGGLEVLIGVPGGETEMAGYSSCDVLQGTWAAADLSMYAVRWRLFDAVNGREG